MGRKPRVDRSPEEKWQIVQEGLKSGNVPGTCQKNWTRWGRPAPPSQALLEGREVRPEEKVKPQAA